MVRTAEGSEVVVGLRSAKVQRLDVVDLISRTRTASAVLGPGAAMPITIKDASTCALPLGRAGPRVARPGHGRDATGRHPGVMLRIVRPLPRGVGLSHIDGRAPEAVGDVRIVRHIVGHFGDVFDLAPHAANAHRSEATE